MTKKPTKSTKSKSKTNMVDDFFLYAPKKFASMGKKGVNIIDMAVFYLQDKQDIDKFTWGQFTGFRQRIETVLKHDQKLVGTIIFPVKKASGYIPNWVGDKTIQGLETTVDLSKLFLKASTAVAKTTENAALAGITDALDLAVIGGNNVVMSRATRKVQKAAASTQDVLVLNLNRRVQYLEEMLETAQTRLMTKDDEHNSLLRDYREEIGRSRALQDRVMQLSDENSKLKQAAFVPA